MFHVDVEKSFSSMNGPFSLNVAFETDSPILVIFGPSGSGKSLTLQLMAGMIAPERGRVAINGRVLFDSGDKVNLPARKRRIGYVFQDYALFPHMSVRSNIAFGLGSPWKPITMGAQRAAIDALLDRFEIGHIADSLPGRISGGQRQRAALARALAMEPDVLFLDEPLSALDPLLRRKVRNDLLETIERTGIPTVLISHDPEDVEAFAKSLVVLGSGSVLKTIDYRQERPAYSSAFEMLDKMME
jgi:molybdate transport system ATP-binding protein